MGYKFVYEIQIRNKERQDFYGSFTIIVNYDTILFHNVNHMYVWLQ